MTVIPDTVLVYSEGLERRGVFISQCAARASDMQKGRRLQEELSKKKRKSEIVDVIREKAEHRQVQYVLLRYAQ